MKVLSKSLFVLGLVALLLAIASTVMIEVSSEEVGLSRDMINDGVCLLKNELSSALKTVDLLQDITSDSPSTIGDYGVLLQVYIMYYEVHLYILAAIGLVLGIVLKKS